MAHRERKQRQGKGWLHLQTEKTVNIHPKGYIEDGIGSVMDREAGSVNEMEGCTDGETEVGSGRSWLDDVGDREREWDGNRNGNGNGNGGSDVRRSRWQDYWRQWTWTGVEMIGRCWVFRTVSKGGGMLLNCSGGRGGCSGGYMKVGGGSDRCCEGTWR
jgi:hypothetical protein